MTRQSTESEAEIGKIMLCAIKERLTFPWQMLRGEMFVKILLSIVLAPLWVPTIQLKFTTLISMLKMELSVCRRKSVPVTTNATKIRVFF